MSLFPITKCGFQRITSSGIVGDSGKPILFCGYSLEAGASATAPVVYNNTSAIAADGAYILQTTLTGTTSIFSLTAPLMLNKGCFINFDGGTSAVTIFYIEAF